MPGNAQALIDWYNAGCDGAVDWGSAGDFDQCVDVASQYMDADQAAGFCNLRHQDAVGGPPGSEDKSAEAKDFSLGSPVASSLAPFDLEGASPNAETCQVCGGPLTDGVCPEHGARKAATPDLLTIIDAELARRGVAP
jgi:hypothetical protein